MFPKAADSTKALHRWEFGGSSMTTAGLRLVSNPGNVARNIYYDFLKLTETFLRKYFPVVFNFYKAA